MQEEAYDAMHELQTHHWWYIGARAVYRTLIQIGLSHSNRPLKMLEVGCGTGGNLALLSEYGPTVGMDVSSFALSKISPRPEVGLLQASATALPFASRTFHGVCLLGVIEHLDADLDALRESARVCQLAGVVVLLTSALPSLWSHHDEANFHKRRYVRSQLKSLIQMAGMDPIHLSYQNFITLLPTALIRLYQRYVAHPSNYDMGTFPEPVNSILAAILKFEAFLIRFITLPIGVDLVAVCRPRE